MGNQTTLSSQATSTSHDLPNCCLYLEGQFATNAGPIPSWPSAGQCLSNGFFVGSMSVAGDYPCRGQMQYLETFDYPRAPTQIPESSPRHPKNLPRISMQSRNAPKTPGQLQLTNPNSQWILPCTDAEFAEKKGKMMAFSAPSARACLFGLAQTPRILKNPGNC